MFSDNRILGLLVAISIPFGMYQVVKNFRGLPGSTTVIEASKDLVDFAKPFFKSDSELDQDMAKKNRFHVQQTAARMAVAANTAPGEFSFKADEKTKKADLAKKDAEKDKKKKKKKKDEKKTAVANRPYYRIEEPRQQPRQVENNNGFVGSYFTPVAAPAKDEENVDAEAAYQKWARILGDAPTFKNFTDFMAAYQNQQIPSEAYYRIVGEMMQANDQQIISWAILASTAVPGYESFSFLTTFIESQSPGAPARTSALTQLERTYQQIGQLGVLRSVLSSGDSELAVTSAARYVEFLARKHLGQETPQGGEEPEPRAVAATAANFSSFISILEGLKQNSNGDIADAADRALRAIQSNMPSQQASGPTE